MASLTERQLKCVQLAADGYTMERTARHLGTSLRTVTTDIQRARTKLGAANITHAVAIAYRTGLFDLGISREQLEVLHLAERLGCQLALVPRAE